MTRDINHIQKETMRCWFCRIPWDYLTTIRLVSGCVYVHLTFRSIALNLCQNNFKVENSLTFMTVGMIQWKVEIIRFSFTIKIYFKIKWTFLLNSLAMWHECDNLSIIFMLPTSGSQSIYCTQFHSFHCCEIKFHTFGPQWKVEIMFHKRLALQK